MKYDISFIHTAKVHVNTFNSILLELAPQLNIHHVVDELLLVHAQQHGVDDALKAKLQSHLEVLSQQSKVVVITCSSIGAMAENVGLLNGCVIQRVDRAMADYAVQNAKNILVIAALESTLQSTENLLKNSMLDIGTSSNISFKCIASAWEYFLNGEIALYYDEIEKVLKSNETDFDLIVLAQASMAGVCDQVSLSIPILSSPKLGVQRAINVVKMLS